MAKRKFNESIRSAIRSAIAFLNDRNTQTWATHIAFKLVSTVGNFTSNSCKEEGLWKSIEFSLGGVNTVVNTVSFFDGFLPILDGNLSLRRMCT